MGKSKYARPLYTIQTVYLFLKETLELDWSENDIKKASIEIVKEEKGKFLNKDTWTSSDVRDKYYQDERSRWELRKQIVEELYSMKRLDDDDDICLGKGGALPYTDIQNDRIAFFIIGLPASGKSTITNIISSKFGAIIVDADYAKRKFPEYTHQCGASLVHEESSIITLGGYELPQDFSVDFYSLVELCASSNCNICIPKIGHDIKSTLKYMEKLKNEFKYKIHVILASMEREEATKGALERYLRTKRYIPLSLIFDGYANDPILCYYRLKKINREKNGTYFESMSAYKTNASQNKIRLVDDEYHKININLSLL